MESHAKNENCALYLTAGGVWDVDKNIFRISLALTIIWYFIEGGNGKVVFDGKRKFLLGILRKARKVEPFSRKNSKEKPDKILISIIIAENPTVI